MGVHLPKIDMKMLDGKDPLTWICPMEEFFSLHQVPPLKNVTITSLYLETK